MKNRETFRTSLHSPAPFPKGRKGCCLGLGAYVTRIRQEFSHVVPVEISEDPRSGSDSKQMRLAVRQSPLIFPPGALVAVVALGQLPLELGCLCRTRTAHPRLDETPTAAHASS